MLHWELAPTGPPADPALALEHLLVQPRLWPDQLPQQWQLVRPMALQNR